MDLATLIENQGEGKLLAIGGLVIGVLFGFFAQRSRFCLRSAVIEFWHGRFGEKLSVWLLAFSTAVIAVQALILSGLLDVTSARQLSTRGSISGALVGGLLFGAGMIMTRGCASRLLVLAASGNLRALLSGLIFAVAAQASLAGALAPLRNAISGWWTVDGGDARDLLALSGSGHLGALLFGMVWLIAAVALATRQKRGIWVWFGSIGTGALIAAGWLFNYQISHNSFQVVPIQSLTFSGPSAEWLMRVLSSAAPPIGFDYGLLPGVFAGAFIGAWLNREHKLEGFKDGYSMRRYIAGAMLMGFGAMLAGGCAVGAGMSGGSVFALTAWLTLGGMWAGAGLTDRLLDAGVSAHSGPELRGMKAT